MAVQNLLRNFITFVIVTFIIVGYVLQIIVYVLLCNFMILGMITYLIHFLFL